MKRTFEEQLMEECSVLVSLLEMSNDEAQQKAIRNMLCEIAIYLNHEDDDEYTISGKCKKRA